MKDPATNNKKQKGEMLIRNSIYKNYDELPLFLNADTVAKTLGISISSCYELLHEKDFPKLNIGNRIVVPKEKFIQWVEQNTVGGIS
jgi:excisionase family DNA binding protein